MTSIVIHALHLLGAGVGFWLISRLARSMASDRLVLAAAAGLSLMMALFMLRVSAPDIWFQDFTDAYLAAGRAVLGGPQALRPLLEQGVDGFVNLPLAAYLFAPFALLPTGAASLAFFALGVAATLAAWRMIARRYGLDREAQALSLFALSAFGPLIYSLREGNTSHILLPPLIVGLGLAAARRDFAAGAVFAAAAIIKPPLMLIGVYYFVRGRFRVVAGGLVLCALSAALSLLIFGWDMHVLWLSEFGAYGGQPMPGYNSQSIASALARFELGPASYRDWTPHALAPALSALGMAMVLGLAVLGAWASLRRDATTPSAPPREDLEPLLVLTFVCMAGTVSWSHYYVWLLPAFAWLFARARAQARSEIPPLALLAAFGLAAPAEFLGAPLAAGAFGPLSGLLASHLLIGGLVCFALLIQARRREGVTPA